MRTSISGSCIFGGRNDDNKLKKIWNSNEAERHRRRGGDETNKTNKQGGDDATETKSRQTNAPRSALTNIMARLRARFVRQTQDRQKGRVALLSELHNGNRRFEDTSETLVWTKWRVKFDVKYDLTHDMT